jgi:hypothetical protein
MTNLRQDLVFGLRMLLARPASRSPQCCRSRSASARTPPSSASLIHRCSPIFRIASPPCGRSVGIARRSARRAQQRDGRELPGVERNSRGRSKVSAPTLGLTMNVGSAQDRSPAERVEVSRFTASMWNVLGARPILGRVFSADEDRNLTPAPVAVLSYKFWQRHFAGDPQIVGKTMRWMASRRTSSA